MLFPGFKFLTTSYPGTTLHDFKKRGNNYKLSGIGLYSKKQKRSFPVELIIHDNFLSGIKIEALDYEVSEFNIHAIQIDRLEKVNIVFPPSEIDLLYEKLDDTLKSMLNPDDIFDIDLGNRTYYAFHDLEDGNYLAIDNKLIVYSLVHDAKPIAKKVNSSLSEILSAIKNKTFDSARHLDERYRNSK